jgi:hypothetical protein
MVSVRLHPRSPDGRPLAAVEHTPVNGGRVGGAGHYAIEDIEFTDEVTLADTADRRIATHLTGIFGPEAEQGGACATSRRRRCRLTSGVTSPNNQDVEHRRSLLAAEVECELFHVEHSFAEAELSEERVEHVFGALPARQSIQRRKCLAQRLCYDEYITVVWKPECIR